MIPKIIHYCWMSRDPFPANIQKCIDSWRTYLPDYELRLWNLDSFGDKCPIWVKEAFDNKKYAFAADYVRAYALYHDGGIYLDSDVEVVKSFNSFLDLPYIVGKETFGDAIEAACMGAEPNHPFFHALLKYYDDRHFVKSDGTFDQFVMPLIIGKVMTPLFKRIDIQSKADFVYLKDVICVFPPEYFSPKNVKNKRIIKTENTVAIHHFEGSWIPWHKRWVHPVQKLLGPKITDTIQTVKAYIFRR